MHALLPPADPRPERSSSAAGDVALGDPAPVTDAPGLGDLVAFLALTDLAALAEAERRIRHEIAEALFDLSRCCPTNTVAAAAADLGDCQWCPPITETGDHPAPGVLVVAYRTTTSRWEYRDAVCAGCVGYAHRDAHRVRDVAAVWFEICAPGPTGPAPQLAVIPAPRVGGSR